MNNRLFQALKCENNGRPPVWLMRQAGRYMPEFRALRAKYDFMTLCKQPELVLQVTKMPIDQLGVDAAILFSDILVVLDALDRGLHFEKGVGPVIDRTVRTSAEIDSLLEIDVHEKLGYVAEGIRLLRNDLDVPLIGFCGAPFTVASYLIEGGSSKELKRTKKWLFKDPEGFGRLLDKLCDVTIEYCKMQVDAGAQAIQVFDSWANALAFRQFEKFSLNYQKRIVDALQPTGVPVILFCRGASVFAESIASVAKPTAVSVDWNVDLPTLARRLPSGVALQGNLDPDVLYADKETIRRESQSLIKNMQSAGSKGFIFNLGHGLKPDMDPSHVRCLVDAVKESQVEQCASV